MGDGEESGTVDICPVGNGRSIEVRAVNRTSGPTSGPTACGRGSATTIAAKRASRSSTTFASPFTTATTSEMVVRLASESLRRSRPISPKIAHHVLSGR